MVSPTVLQGRWATKSWARALPHSRMGARWATQCATGQAMARARTRGRCSSSSAMATHRGFLGFWFGFWFGVLAAGLAAAAFFVAGLAGAPFVATAAVSAFFLSVDVLDGCRAERQRHVEVQAAVVAGGILAASHQRVWAPISGAFQRRQARRRRSSLGFGSTPCTTLCRCGFVIRGNGWW